MTAESQQRSDVDREQLTRLLHAARKGDRGAEEQAWEQIYPTLRMLAHRQLQRSGAVTLETSALVHEAYFRLAGGGEPADRNHFLSLAATAMRQIVIDSARRRSADKRGAGQAPVTLTGVAAFAASSNPVSVLDLDRALEGLEEVDPRLARIVELRFFGGLTVEETAETLGVSTPTIKRDTRVARAFLRRELS